MHSVTLQRSRSVLSIANTLSGRRQPLLTHFPSALQVYICGPTVYDRTHLGHAFTYVRYDSWRRAIDRMTGHRTRVAMCITDIDDKIVRKAMETNQSCRQVSRLYEGQFFGAMQMLGVQKPTLVLRVTDHVPTLVRFIQKLIDKDAAYVTKDGSVYFNSAHLGTKYPRFVKKQKLDDEQSESDSEGRRTKSDFALWKSVAGESLSTNDSTFDVTFTNSGTKVTSRGRPGWHIECSTLADVAFGPYVDVHGGGSDLIFPHHENELAQSTAYYSDRQGCKCSFAPTFNDWVTSWMHTGSLNVASTEGDGDNKGRGSTKMSKSLGNFVTVDELFAKYRDKYSDGQISDGFRHFCLSAPSFRSHLDYSDVALGKSIETVSNCVSTFQHLRNAVMNSTIDDRRRLYSIESCQQLHSRTEEMLDCADKCIADSFSLQPIIHRLSHESSFLNGLLSSPVDSTDDGFECSSNPAPVMAFLTAVDEVFGHAFGIRSLALLSDNVRKDNDATKVKVKVADDDRLKVAVSIADELRGATRAAALELKSAESEDVKKKLFSACDVARERLKMECDVTINDHKSGTGVMRVK